MMGMSREDYWEKQLGPGGLDALQMLRMNIRHLPNPVNCPSLKNLITRVAAACHIPYSTIEGDPTLLTFMQHIFEQGEIERDRIRRAAEAKAKRLEKKRIEREAKAAYEFAVKELGRKAGMC